MENSHEPLAPPTIDDYWMALYRQKGIILFVAIFAVIFSILISSMITPRYEAKAVFYVPEDIVSPSDVSGREIGKARAPSGSEDRAKAYAAVLKGKDAKQKVHERFPKKPLEELVRDSDFSASREGLIRIYVRDGDPVLAANIANGFIDYFNEFIRGATEDDLVKSLMKIEGEIRDVERQLESTINSRQIFQEKHNIASLNTELEEMEKNRINFQQKLQDALVDLQSTDQQIGSLNHQLSNESEMYQTGNVVLTNKVIESLQETIAQIEVDLAGKMSELRPNHPEIIALRQKYDTAKDNLVREISRIIRSKSKLPDSLYENLRQRLTLLYVDRKAAEARIQGFKEIIDGINQKILEIPKIIAESDRLERMITDYVSVKRNLEMTQDNLRTGSLQLKKAGLVVETARPPKRAIFPILWLNVTVSGLFGLLTGVILAFFFEHLELRRRLKKLREIESEEWAKALLGELS